MANNEAAKLLNVAGRALYPQRPDWKSQLAFDLQVPTHTVRQWEKGHMRFDPDHGAIDDLINICTERESQVRRAKEYLISYRMRQLKKEAVENSN